MRKIQRQISSVVIVVLLFAALATSLSLWALKPGDAAPNPPGYIEIPPDGPPPLDPAPGETPIVALVLAGVAAALVPISISFLLDKHLR